MIMRSATMEEAEQCPKCLRQCYNIVPVHSNGNCRAQIVTLFLFTTKEIVSAVVVADAMLEAPTRAARCNALTLVPT